MSVKGYIEPIYIVSLYFEDHGYWSNLYYLSLDALVHGLRYELDDKDELDDDHTMHLKKIASIISHGTPFPIVEEIEGRFGEVVEVEIDEVDAFGIVKDESK